MANGNAPRPGAHQAPGEAHGAPRSGRLSPEVVRLAEARLPTRFGRFRISVYQAGGSREIAVLSRGALEGGAPPLLRLHSECLTGEALGSLRCDCGEQLDAALGLIAAEGRGILLYLRQEGRGIGLTNKIRAYALQDSGLDTVDANLALGLPVDGRDYASAAAVLRHLEILRVRLLTNNPVKLQALQRLGIQVVERVPLEIPPNPVSLPYLRTKATRMGHALSPDDRGGERGGLYLSGGTPAGWRPR